MALTNASGGGALVPEVAAAAALRCVAVGPPTRSVVISWLMLASPDTATTSAARLAGTVGALDAARSV